MLFLGVFFGVGVDEEDLVGFGGYKVRVGSKEDVWVVFGG